MGWSARFFHLELTDFRQLHCRCLLQRRIHRASHDPDRHQGNQHEARIDCHGCPLSVCAAQHRCWAGGACARLVSGALRHSANMFRSQRCYRRLISTNGRSFGDEPGKPGRHRCVPRRRSAQEDRANKTARRATVICLLLTNGVISQSIDIRPFWVFMPILCSCSAEKEIA